MPVCLTAESEGKAKNDEFFWESVWRVSPVMMHRADEAIARAEVDAVAPFIVNAVYHKDMLRSLRPVAPPGSIVHQVVSLQVAVEHLYPFSRGIVRPADE